MFCGTHRFKNTCKHVFYVYLSLGSFYQYVTKAYQYTAGEACVVAKQTISGALLMETKSTAYADLGATALPERLSRS